MYSYEQIGSYVAMLKEIIDTNINVSNVELAKQERKNALQLIFDKNVSLPLLDEWVSWGMPVSKDDTFRFFMKVFEGFSSEIVFTEYQESMYWEYQDMKFELSKERNQDV
tara:strand:+ start:1255 stop:1584 length:330 start_codon:yes stop_codon:yes gene_type:complete